MQTGILSGPVTPNTSEGLWGRRAGELCRGTTVLPQLFLVFMFGS